MEGVLVFVMIFAAVASRNIPDTDYFPSVEDLEAVFEDSSPNLTNPVEAVPAATVPDEIIFTVKKPTPTLQKTSLIQPAAAPITVALDITINLNACDKPGDAKENSKTPYSADDVTTLNQTPVNGIPKVLTRLNGDSVNDDKWALGVKDCSSKQVRVGDTCVEPDK